ncbi:hypothetical protein [Kordiimonas sp. SCSIO 12610]|uniref:hypothetical protein n=1 Tax=Kordiimonas sp. SCSIO 12610 TaxID=2829597 RepID=UPI0021089936|nr:hypothetical protein [Kordiimonas sp. SCSIO 12610]UTW56787.1 hypothetical protein KFF44_07835 [Kordiimonas sp. SCSIO 12610]
MGNLSNLKSLDRLRAEHPDCSLYVGDDVKDHAWPLALDLYNNWDSHKKGRPACSRQDLSVISMKQQLPLIVLHDVIGPNKRLKVRVIGTEFVDAIGFDTTGQYVDEVPNAERVVDRCNWSIHHCLPFLSIGVKLTFSHYDYKVYDSILLPLIDDEGEVNMLLTYSHFH